MIKKNTFSPSSITLSELGFGASPLGNIYETISENDAKQLIHKAIDYGITYFDVAPYYGHTLAETRLGTHLPKNKSNLIISTKVGRYGDTDFNFSTQKTIDSIYASLKRLKTDYIDIIFCHDIEFVDPKVIIQETIPTLVQLREKGLIKTIGISGYNINKLIKLSKNNHITTVLTYGHYSLLNSSIKTHLETFKKNKVDLINASPFCMGLLTKNNCPDWHPYKEKNKIKTKIDALTKQNINIEETSFKYALNQTLFKSTLTGIASTTQLNQLLEWYKNKELNQHLEETLHTFKSFIPVKWETN